MMTGDNMEVDYTYTRILLCDDRWTTRRSTTLTPEFYCMMTGDNMEVDYTYTRFLLCDDR